MEKVLNDIELMCVKFDNIKGIFEWSARLFSYSQIWVIVKLPGLVYDWDKYSRLSWNDITKNLLTCFIVLMIHSPHRFGVGPSLLLFFYTVQK